MYKNQRWKFFEGDVTMTSSKRLGEIFKITSPSGEELRLPRVFLEEQYESAAICALLKKAANNITIDRDESDDAERLCTSLEKLTHPQPGMIDSCDIENILSSDTVKYRITPRHGLTSFRPVMVNADFFNSFPTLEEQLPDANRSCVRVAIDKESGDIRDAIFHNNLNPNEKQALVDSYIEDIRKIAEEDPQAAGHITIKRQWRTPQSNSSGRVER